MAAAYPINPMYLLGRYFDFSEAIGDGGAPCLYSAQVLAVQVPCPLSSVPWALLLKRSDYPDELEYVPLDSLSFEWPVVS